MIARPLMLLCGILAESLLAATPLAAATDTFENTGVVRVRVTGQAHDFTRPWLKRPPLTREAVGAVLSGNRVLVTAELVANHNYIELEHPSSGEKIPAAVRRVDYDCNLALIEPSEPSFLPRIRALPLAEEPATGDSVHAVQFESSGAPMRTPLTLTTVEIGTYPISDLPLLLYRLSGALQYRDGSFTLPLIHAGQLAGIVMRYDLRTQASDAISTPVLRWFLDRASQGDAPGVPRAGVSFTPTRDPQLRRFLGLRNGSGGVLVTQVEPRGPAAAGGLIPGDVLLAIGDRRIDQDGNFEHPRHGRVGLAHLISQIEPGRTLSFRILRDGKERSLPVAPLPRTFSDWVSPPYQFDTPPRYLVLGGLVFQELGRQFLREWGPGWEKRAPQRLLYLDRFQSELFPEGGRRIVFLTGVLPTPATLGYEQLGSLVVRRANGREIRSLEDLDAALQAPLEGFHRIEFDDEPHEIVIDPGEAERIAPVLRRHYGLAELRRL